MLKFREIGQARTKRRPRGLGAGKELDFREKFLSKDEVEQDKRMKRKAKERVLQSKKTKE